MFYLFSIVPNGFLLFTLVSNGFQCLSSDFHMSSSICFGSFINWGGYGFGLHVGLHVPSSFVLGRGLGELLPTEQQGDVGDGAGFPFDVILYSTSRNASMHFHLGIGPPFHWHADAVAHSALFLNAHTQYTRKQIAYLRQVLRMSILEGTYPTAPEGLRTFFRSSYSRRRWPQHDDWFLFFLRWDL